MSYQEGDPDRPFVLALVPDPSNFVPYELPGNKTRTVVKTKTYKGVGSNEFRLEDLTNQEEIYVHAQRDHNTVVENDRTDFVKQDSITRVGENQISMTGGFGVDYTVKDKWTRVGGNLHHYVGGSLTLPWLDLPANLTDQSNVFLKNGTAFYGCRSPCSGNGDYNLNVFGGMYCYVGSGLRFEANENLEMSAGQQTLLFSSGTFMLKSTSDLNLFGDKATNIYSENEILIHCGDKAYIKLSSDGTIELRGVKITLN